MRYLVVLLVLLAGCVSRVWVQPGKSEADFRRDAYECEVDAAPVQAPRQARAMWHRCLETKGWSWEKKPR